MIENEITKPEQPTPTQGPGDRLQFARISIGLTLQDVANKMHLSESILSSLEENDFEDITAPIFVKGYLRSYARIVNLDENDIIQQYTSFYTDGDPPITSTSNTSPEINADDARVKWITWLVILSLVALLSAWWWNRYQQPAQPLSLDSTEQPTDVVLSSPIDSPATTGADLSPDTQLDQALSQQVQQDLAVLSKQPAEEPVASTRSTEMLTAEDMDAVPVEAQSEEAPQVEPVDTAAMQELAETDISQPANEVNIEESPEPVMDDEGLVVTVNADTWTDIRDADGKKLIYDLLRSGEKISVSGKTPMRAFFGNGYGVSMKYQGKDIDLSKVIRDDNTAKIKIGQ